MILDPNGRNVSPGAAADDKPSAPQRGVLLSLGHIGAGNKETLEDVLTTLQESARQDGHNVIAPTHVMVKGAEVIGYLSLAGMPTVYCWFDSKATKASDSIKMIEHGETVLREKNARHYAVAVGEDSPFAPHMERLGFSRVDKATIWIKQL